MIFQQHIGYTILVANVTYEEYQVYLQWHAQQRWDIGEGYLFPAPRANTAFLYLDAGLAYGATWFSDIRPALVEYWGEERVISDGEWRTPEQAEYGAPAGSIGAEDYKDRREIADEKAVKKIGFNASYTPNIPPRKRR